MLRQSLVKPNSIKLFLILQFIPLILFPPESFKTQEWWLPVLLAVLVVIAVDTTLPPQPGFMALVLDFVCPGFQHHQPLDDDHAARHPQ